MYGYQPYTGYNYQPVYQQQQNSFQPVQSYSPINNNLQQQTQSQQMSMINGKIVDNKETVAVQDVPIGSYGVYPKADQSMIWVKTWTPQGNTQIDEYVKVETNEEKSNDVILSNFDNLSEALDNIKSSIKDLSKRLDTLSQDNSSSTSSSYSIKRKKVIENE